MIISESRTERTKRVATKAVRAVVLDTIAVAVLIAGVSALLSETLTYEPFEVGYYRVISDVVCPGQESGIEYGLRVTRPALGDVRESVVLSQGANADTGKALAIETYPAPFSGRYGYREDRSDFVRFAPNEPGRWYLRITYEVRGFQALRPNLQILSDVESNAVTVLSFDAPRCRSVGT